MDEPDIYDLITSDIPIQAKLIHLDALLKAGADPNSYLYEDSPLSAAINGANTQEEEALALMLLGSDKIKLEANLLLKSLLKNHINIPARLIELGYTPGQEELRGIKELLKNPDINDRNKELILALLESIRAKKLYNLRTHRQLDPRRLTGENAPSMAYVIMGHGEELPEMKIVPKGCILVVKVHSGELSYNTHELFTKIFNGNGSDYLDPVSNYSKILNNLDIGNFAIYREGDTYPDFNYHLLSMWENHRQGRVYDLSDSGIEKYPFTKRIVKLNSYYNDLPYEIPVKDIIKNLYTTSIYPNIESIDGMLNIIDTDASKLSDYINNPLFEVYKTIKQSELFNKAERRDGFEPGVFYNFICRATKLSLVKNGDSLVINNSMRFPLGMNRVRGMKPEILQAIGEAEFHRAPLLSSREYKITEFNKALSPNAFLNRNYIEGLPPTYTRKFKVKLIDDAIQTYRNDLLTLFSSNTHSPSEKKQMKDYIVGIISGLSDLRNKLVPRARSYTYKISNKEREQMRIQKLSHNAERGLSSRKTRRAR